LSRHDTAAARTATGLRLWPATALVIGHTIAVGIFLTPAEIIGSLASPAVTIGLWTVCAALALAGALTFGELAARYPLAGGPSIATVVSVTTGVTYCTSHLEFLRRVTLDHALVEALRIDYRTAPIDDRDRVVLDYAAQVTRDASAVTDEHHAPFARGWIRRSGHPADS